MGKMTMKRFFAVCFMNGPISVAIRARTTEQALAKFEAMDKNDAVEFASVDAEDEFDVDGSGMDETEFAAMLESHGYQIVADLSEVVAGSGATERAAHVAGGWVLWAPNDAA